MSSLVHIAALIFLSCAQNVYTQTLSMTGCDALKEGQTTVIEATFNISRQSECSGIGPLTRLFWLASNETTSLCSYEISQGCQNSPTSANCSCVSAVDNIWTIRLNFVFSSTVHSGGTLEVTTNCLPDNTFDGGDTCENLASAPDPTTAEPTTAEPTTAKPTTADPATSGTSDNPGAATAIQNSFHVLFGALLLAMFITLL